MQDIPPGTPSGQSEGAQRLHAAIRVLLSPGIWFVLAAQMLLLVALQWRVPEDTVPLLSLLVIFLTALCLMAFFYLQAGAFHALTRGRETLPVAEVIRAGRPVFASFVWLTLKAGLLFAVGVNVLMLVAVMLTGADFKSLVEPLSAAFGPLAGLLGFIFVYWLPFVFVRNEFHLFPSLQAALQLFWQRLSRSAFLALLVLAPALVAIFIPADSPLAVTALASLVSGLLGWIAFVYCVDTLQQQPQESHA